MFQLVLILNLDLPTKRFPELVLGLEKDSDCEESENVLSIHESLLPHCVLQNLGEGFPFYTEFVSVFYFDVIEICLIIFTLVVFRLHPKVATLLPACITQPI